MSRVTLLATQGVQVRIDADFVDELKTARLWDGTPVPAGLQERLTHDWIQLQYLESRLRELKSTRLVRQRDLAPPTARAITRSYSRLKSPFSKPLARATGTSKKEAEQEAARLALEKLGSEK